MGPRKVGIPRISIPNHRVPHPLQRAQRMGHRVHSFHNSPPWKILHASRVRLRCRANAASTLSQQKRRKRRNTNPRAAELYSGAVIRCADTIPGMREKVVLRAVIEFITRTQLATDVETNSSNTNSNRSPANNRTLQTLLPGSPESFRQFRRNFGAGNGRYHPCTSCRNNSAAW